MNDTIMELYEGRIQNWISDIGESAQRHTGKPGFHAVYRVVLK